MVPAAGPHRAFLRWSSRQCARAASYPQQHAAVHAVAVQLIIVLLPLLPLLLPLVLHKPGQATCSWQLGLLRLVGRLLLLLHCSRVVSSNRGPPNERHACWMLLSCCCSCRGWPATAGGHERWHACCTWRPATHASGSRRAHARKHAALLQQRRTSRGAWRRCTRRCICCQLALRSWLSCTVGCPGPAQAVPAVLAAAPP